MDENNMNQPFGEEQQGANEVPFSEKVGGFAQNAVEKTSEFAKKTGEFAKDAASKTKDFAVDAFEKTKEFVNQTADRAKELAEIAKINSQIRADNDKISQTYKEIGRIYYNEMRTDGTEEINLLCNAVNELKNAIAVNEAKVAELKEVEKPGEQGTEE